MKINGLFVLLLLFSACGTKPSANNVSLLQDTSKANVREVLPILPRTQHSDKFANINCSLEDRNGNLWFGSSAEGLYRFDGKSFTQFTTGDGLCSNKVKCLMESQLGEIWIGTSDGICKINGNVITKVPIVVPDPSVLVNPQPPRTNEIWSMIQDRTGTMWFGTSMGMFCYNGSKFSRFPNDFPITNKDSLQLKMIDDMLIDQKGIMWFASGTTEGVVMYSGNEITSSKPNGDEWIRTMMQRRNGTIWFNGRLHGDFTYSTNGFQLFKDKQKIGSAMLEDRNGYIWFSGEENDDGYSGVDGIWCYDGKDFKNYGTKDGLGNYGVWTMLEDRNGNIWFGTRNNGLYKFDGKSFTCYSE